MFSHQFYTTTQQGSAEQFVNKRKTRSGRQSSRTRPSPQGVSDMVENVAEVPVIEKSVILGLLCADRAWSKLSVQPIGSEVNMPKTAPGHVMLLYISAAAMRDTPNVRTVLRA